MFGVLYSGGFGFVFREPIDIFSFMTFCEDHRRRPSAKGSREGHRRRDLEKAIGEGSHKGILFGVLSSRVSDLFFENLLPLVLNTLSS